MLSGQNAMKLRNYVILAGALAVLNAHSQGQLPPCSGSYSTATWTNCVGELTFPNGRNYIGEFKYGVLNGQGTSTLPSGEKYVGEWRDGKSHGQGTFTFSNGTKYVGEWRDGKRHGQGTLTSPDGLRYV